MALAFTEQLIPGLGWLESGRARPWGSEKASLECLESFAATLV
jgi:hypothetical protein